MTEASQPSPTPAPNFEEPNDESRRGPAPEPQAATPDSTGPLPRITPRHAAAPPRFDGAGIVQRATLASPAAPRHVLLAPGGRILAWLQESDGVDLDQYLGRPMGLNGPRIRRDDLGADLIIVQYLTPVRLTAPARAQ
ncbi:MAG: hypothetical protein ACREJB_13045 [Planctomycetaceae bacterium]